MARQIIVLALILFAIVGMASAAKPAEPAPATEAALAADGPSDDIGTTDADDDAAPVGGPVPAGTFSTSSSESPSGAPGSSAASGLQVSTIAGVAATAAGAAFFF